LGTHSEEGNLDEKLKLCCCGSIFGQLCEMEVGGDGLMGWGGAPAKCKAGDGTGAKKLKLSYCDFGCAVGTTVVGDGGRGGDGGGWWVHKMEGGKGLEPKT